MKKSMAFIAAFALTTAMVSSISTSAADVTTEASKNLTLKYESASSYTVTIPDTIESIDDEINVQAKDVVIAKGKNLNVSVSSEGEFALTLEEDSLEYTLKNGNTEIEEDTPFISLASTQTANVKLAVELVEGETAKYAGDYTDTLTFKVSIDEAPAQTPSEPGGEPQGE